VNPDIPADHLEPARARVDQLLEALRRKTEQLGPQADSALSFSPEQGAPDETHAG
jgi:hypothetical protein